MGGSIRNTIAGLLLACVPASIAGENVPCRSDPARLEARSKELQAIVKADQADRRNWAGLSEQETQRLVERDVERRKRVGAIFGEGCFQTAEDFAAAALVYQHGDVPEHYLQAFMWAKRAVELGGDQERLMAVAIERYLVNIGHKQLFASQAGKNEGEKCWCLDPIESSFPEKLREKIGGQSLQQAFAWLGDLNEGRDCPDTECSKKLKPSPAETVPGLW